MSRQVEARSTTWDPALIARCRAISTSAWSDALDRLGIEGVLDGIVTRAGAARTAGPAVTIREDAGPLGSHRLERFDVGAILGAASNGGVAVIAMSGAVISSFGGSAARAAVLSGVAGIVIDGGCRDIEEVRGTGLFVASRHVTPRSGKRRVHVAEIGVPVTCGGVTIRSGDLVIGDETGVVGVPAERAHEALAAAEDLSGKDSALVAGLAAGEDFGTLATRLRHL